MPRTTRDQRRAMRRRGRTSGAYLLRIGRWWARFRGRTAPAVDAERYATETVTLANGSRIDFARGPGERFLAASYGYHWTPDQATADAPPKAPDHAPDVQYIGRPNPAQDAFKPALPEGHVPIAGPVGAVILPGSTADAAVRGQIAESERLGCEDFPREVKAEFVLPPGWVEFPGGRVRAGCEPVSVETRFDAFSRSQTVITRDRSGYETVYPHQTAAQVRAWTLYAMGKPWKETDHA